MAAPLVAPGFAAQYCAGSAPCTGGKERMAQYEAPDGSITQYAVPNIRRFAEPDDSSRIRGADGPVCLGCAFWQGEVEQISMMKPIAQGPHDTGLLEYLEDIIGTDALKPRIEAASKQCAIHPRRPAPILPLPACEPVVPCCVP